MKNVNEIISIINSADLNDYRGSVIPTMKILDSIRNESMANIGEEVHTDLLTLVYCFSRINHNEFLSRCIEAIKEEQNEVFMRDSYGDREEEDGSFVEFESEMVFCLDTCLVKEKVAYIYPESDPEEWYVW